MLESWQYILYDAVRDPLAMPLEVNQINSNISQIGCCSSTPGVTGVIVVWFVEDIACNTLKFSNCMLTGILDVVLSANIPVFQKPELS